SLLRPAEFDCHVPALDIAHLAQTSPERGHLWHVVFRRFTIEEPDHRYRGPLSERGDRPRRRTAEQRDELAAPDHSITSPARASSVSGTVRPSAFAVLRLITSSSLVDS